MRKIFFNYQVLLFFVTWGFFSVCEVKAENKKFADIKSCRNYPYKEGINFQIRNQNSFQILSTSLVEVFDHNKYSIFFPLEEAKLVAKVNLANFLKLKYALNTDDFLNQDLNIRNSGKLIKNKSQIKRDLKYLHYDFSDGLRGIRFVDGCYRNGKYVMATIEVTNETYKMSETLIKTMK